MELLHTEFTSCGLAREVYQDSIFAVSNGGCGLFAVADGMGGHYGGEIASSCVTDMLADWWNKFLSEKYEFEKCCDDLRQIMYDANESIFCGFTQGGKICGTTVGLLMIYEDRYILINSGDTRIYTVCGMKVKQLSRDHVYGSEAAISGNVSKKEIQRSPDKNKLTAAVGCKKDLKMYVTTSLLNTKKFIICSDGVYKFCGAPDIAFAFFINNPRDFLVRKIEKSGAVDNYSFVKITVKEKE